VELARQDVGPGHPALVSLEEIGKASRRAKDLVQQILAFGRRQKLERKATSLALVVVETARLVRATLSAKVRLQVQCEADTPVVLADATQVSQILLNLCANASQALEGAGRPGVIEINLGPYSRAEGGPHRHLPPGCYARLTVRDNGPGMDDATRARIFEPFFTTKEVGKGTGLGLAVVHGIVQGHQAHIEVESAPGEGTAFRVYFPAIDAPVETVATRGTDFAPAHGAEMHVLYVDDEEAIVFLMTRLLQRQGYRVTGYTDPREALAAVREDAGQFDLAVTDFNMPGMSGLDLARALRDIRVDLPVVLASGYITEDLRQEAPAAGVRELIYKPNTADDLCAAVARFAHAQRGKKALPEQFHLL
jgi:CheY-like chemotaxis protein